MINTKYITQYIARSSITMTLLRNFGLPKNFSKSFLFSLRLSSSESIQIKFVRASSSDTLESLFVRSRFSYASVGVEHHLGLPTFSYLLNLWTSNVGKVLSDLQRHRNSLPTKVSDGSSLPKAIIYDSKIFNKLRVQYMNNDYVTGLTALSLSLSLSRERERRERGRGRERNRERERGREKCDKKKTSAFKCLSASFA